MPQHSDTRRIVKNTLMLYVRMGFIMLVNLFLIRLVMCELGVEDFGIYNVIAGVVALCSFLGNSMASATQRFFSFALGKRATAFRFAPRPPQLGRHSCRPKNPRNPHNPRLKPIFHLSWSASSATGDDGPVVARGGT